LRGKLIEGKLIEEKLIDREITPEGNYMKEKLIKVTYQN
jgi:hypothetical protein